jgi:hypothetical protein
MEWWSDDSAHFRSNPRKASSGAMGCRCVRMRERLRGLGAFDLYRGNKVIEVLKQQNRIVGVRTRDIVTGLEREFLAP